MQRGPNGTSIKRANNRKQIPSTFKIELLQKKNFIHSQFFTQPNLFQKNFYLHRDGHSMVKPFYPPKDKKTFNVVAFLKINFTWKKKKKRKTPPLEKKRQRTNKRVQRGRVSSTIVLSKHERPQLKVYPWMVKVKTKVKTLTNYCLVPCSLHFPISNPNGDRSLKRGLLREDSTGTIVTVGRNLP